MSTITPHYRSVQQLLQSRSFSIDEYQREYKWEKSNVDELLTDLQLKFQSCYRAGDDTRMVTGEAPVQSRAASSAATRTRPCGARYKPACVATGRLSRSQANCLT